jgi:uncharacterized damage-inducible protein DinB
MAELLTPEKLWEHWEGHRRLTLRTVEAYPEAQLSTYKAGPMRTFAELMAEIVNVEESVMNGLRSGRWAWEPAYTAFASKTDLLTTFEKVRKGTRETYPTLTAEKLQAVETDGWGVQSSNLERLLYVIDNEIHHRAQSYVYLRLLGVEPPAFYER